MRVANTDLDPAFYFNADPDPSFHLMRIRIRTLQSSILASMPLLWASMALNSTAQFWVSESPEFWIQSGSGTNFPTNADPDLVSDINADPYGSGSATLHPFWIRIRSKKKLYLYPAENFVHIRISKCNQNRYGNAPFVTTSTFRRWLEAMAARGLCWWPSLSVSFWLWPPSFPPSSSASHFGVFLLYFFIFRIIVYLFPLVSGTKK